MSKENILENTSYNPLQIEKEIYATWLKKGCFNPDKQSQTKKKSFTVAMAPPNITGSLHMGHALENTLTDIVVRKKRMEGYNVLWAPGIDHAGIAAQNVVEKELRKENLSRFDLGREKFEERVWQWKEKSGNTILEQFKTLGVSADWSRLRFTLDVPYQKAVQNAFIHYYEKGLIYRGNRVVNWCPRCHTSISDLEVEYREEKSSLWYIKYPLKKGGYITVATTRPETMLGDTAIAVAPGDKRYVNLIGEYAVLPIMDREIPIIADKALDKDFGTGALKVTPAHSPIDFEIGQRHNLEFISVIDDFGRFNSVTPERYQGLKMIEGRAKVLEELKNLNLLEKIEDYDLSLPVCMRCGAEIQPQISNQWFLKMDNLGVVAAKAVKSKAVQIVPKNFEKTYFDWLKNVKDWCISRQIWWGHRLPVWYCICDTKQISPVISIDKPKNKCLKCGKNEWVQTEDVLDTWFSSALWPFAVLGWTGDKKADDKCKNFKTYYPTSYMTSARDIFHLWITRMIYSGIEFTGKAPFNKVYIHATVMNKEGKRMSKSLGTGVDPLLLINTYGADATRFGLTWQATGVQDIRFNEEFILSGKKFLNKLWNASRFVILNLKDKTYSDKKPTSLKLNKYDKQILTKLGKIIKQTNTDLDKERFGQSLQNLYQFFWHDFCDLYLEQSKKSPSPETNQVLYYVLENCLRLFHPYIPFVTEYIWQLLPGKVTLLITESWPKVS